ncbi:hypothetical protein [Streptomyces sp. MBT84]|uniref:hypothetical protein n=1 Tax=Streptomyces sp. MBT84 TaxID=1488414 RepID=UPI001C6EAF5D|nr:hypothetical protein [Streptomyces sp. MBT84]
MNGLEFRERYQEIGRTAKREGSISPMVDVHTWKQFADECVAGYDDNLAEYRGDLWIRRNIQLALDDVVLRRLEGFDAFSDAVQRADEVFKSVATVIFPVKDTSRYSWWNLIIPRYGGEEFASDLRRECGIVIAVKK